MTRLAALVLCTAWAWLSACSQVHQPPPEPSCANPRAATDSLLAWQAPAHHDLSRATRCMNTPEGANAEQLAVHLKQILDAEGHWVPVDSLSDDPNYVDSDGIAEVRPLPRAVPWLVIRKGPDHQWRYSEATLRHVPTAYKAVFPTSTLALQNALPPVFMTRVAGVYLWQMLYGVVLLTIAWIVGRMVRWILRDQVVRFARRRNVPFDMALYARTNAPLMALAMCAVILWGLPALQLPIGISKFLFWAFDLAARLSGIGVALASVNVVADFAERLATATQSKLDDQLVPLLRTTARTVVLAFGLLIVLEAMGVDVWKLIAGVGIGSLAIALAAQDTVANVFGTLNIFIDRPFQIGDAIDVNGVAGSVEEVGFRSTRIRTFDNSQVTIPNSKLTNANVTNLGMRVKRRVKLNIGLTYDTPPAKLQAYVEGIRAILAAHPDVEQSYEVHVHDFGPSSIDLLVYYHVATDSWTTELTTRGQNMLEFMRLAERLEVAFAFPSTSLYVESTPDNPLAPHAATTVEDLQKAIDAFGPGGDASDPRGPQFRPSYTAANAPAPTVD